MARATSYYKERLLKTSENANEKSGRISFIATQYDNRKGIRSAVGAGVSEPVAEELENMFHVSVAGRSSSSAPPSSMYHQPQHCQAEPDMPNELSS